MTEPEDMLTDIVGGPFDGQQFHFPKRTYDFMRPCDDQPTGKPIQYWKYSASREVGKEHIFHFQGIQEGLE
jgi:hypothetical protein